MPFLRNSRLTTATIRSVITAVLVVLAFGLPRLMVVCTGPHCEGRIEVAHVSGSCCEREHGGHDTGTRARDRAQDGCDHGSHASVGCRDHGDVADGGLGEGAPAAAHAGHGHCVDVALAIGIGPLPQRVVVDHDQPPCLGPSTLDATVGCTPCVTEVGPPATGPPRTDQRTELLASTLLLL